MIRGRARLAAVLALATASTGLAGCLRSTTFACTLDEECTGSAPGRCEPAGFCSFPDGSCESGSRFGEHAGPLSDQCVDGGGPTGCPATYERLPGVATHVYRPVTLTGTWMAHQTQCTSEGGYLVEPDDAAELQAVSTLAGVLEFWVGISDQAAEGTFVTGRGGTPAFLPWELGEPDNGPSSQGDCVRSLETGTYADDRCSAVRFAVCECDPL